jgi:hypothetical protein
MAAVQQFLSTTTPPAGQQASNTTTPPAGGNMSNNNNNNNTAPAPAALTEAQIMAIAHHVVTTSSAEVMKEMVATKGEVVGAIDEALAQYRAENSAWYQSKWVYCGAGALVLGAVGYGLYKTNKKASAALSLATESGGILKEMGLSRDSEGVLTASNLKLNG